MRKELLRKLRSLPATPAIIKAASAEIEYEERYYWKKGSRKVKEAKYNILCRGQQLSGIYKLALFIPENVKKGITTPKYEIFINPTGFEFLTRELDEKGKEVRWSTSMIVNLSGFDFYNHGYIRKEPHYLTQDTRRLLIRLSADAINKDLKDKKGLVRLALWQQAIRDENIRKAEERETAPWDQDMKLVPEPLEAFKEWMRKDACRERFIFYEYKKGGAVKGYCSRCKTDVSIKNPKHNTRTTCPHCKTKALFKASGKIKNLWTDKYPAAVIQKFKGGIVIRRFIQYQTYYNDYRKPKIVTHETDRNMLFDSGEVRSYSMGVYKNKYRRWCLIKNNSGCSPDYYWNERYGIMLYKRNLNKLKDYAVFKRSAILLWDKLPTNPYRYLMIERGNPAVEMLAKMGMFKLAEGLMKVTYDKRLLNQDATEIAKMLKIDGSRLKRLKAMNGNITHLRWMQSEKICNTIWPDDMIKDFGDADIITSDFGFLDPPLSYVKIHNYLIKQADMMSESLNQTLSTWRDYHNMASQAKMNTKLDYISRPKDLKAAHDELVIMRESEGIKKEAAALRKKWPKAEAHMKHLKKFEYKTKEYQIVAPGNLEDIVKEGKILRHCVHTCDYYFSRIQSDESYLFFLRKTSSPDMPWYTLEVEPSGNIRQKRTTGDSQNKDFEDAIDFLKAWQRYFKKKLTAKEKKLGEKSDFLRKENYKNLRKDQKRVWHGKLAGQLLADVLEADFMEATGF